MDEDNRRSYSQTFFVGIEPLYEYKMANLDVRALLGYALTPVDYARVRKNTEMEFAEIEVKVYV